MGFFRRAVLTVMALALVLGTGTVFAGSNTDYAGESMAIGVGARPLGMGGTFVAIADDASTSYWNPAGMVNITGVEVSSVKLTKANFEEGNLESKYSYVNVVYNTGSAGAFGLGWLRQAIDGIDLTDVYGNLIADSQENADNVVYLAYAYPIIKGISAGATGKVLLGNYPAVVNMTASNTSYTGFGLDLGLFFNVGDFVNPLKGLSAGLNLQDLFTQITWDEISGVSDGGTETVALNLKPGIAYRLPIEQFEIIASCDLDTKYQMNVHFGGEVWWNKMIAIRGGMQTWGSIANDTGNENLSQDANWSIGASIRWYFIGIDYAYVYNELTPVQYLSIIGKF
ncbi:MAG: PorV/PorQ family protein [Spirochaetia bacterium]|nr:PorV/PorQ family protein [Spirochaetia bacterium]